MTVRITVGDAGNARRILIEGRLCADAVGELEAVIGGDPRGFVLDLGNLSFADAAGVAALRRLREAGAEIEGVRPHLAWQIDESEQ